MRIILVTGSPRSGTTAVGRNLALPPTVGSLYEPFNVHAGLKEIRHQFEIVGANNFTIERLAGVVDSIEHLRLPSWKAPIRPTDNLVRRLLKHGVGGLGRRSYLKCRLNPFIDTMVWKDPLAAFLAKEVAQRYGMPVLVTVRPPQAVAASFKRMNWKPDPNAIIDAFRQAGWNDHGLRKRFGSGFHEPTIAAAAVWWLVYSNLSIGRAAALTSSSFRCKISSKIRSTSTVPSMISSSCPGRAGSRGAFARNTAKSR